MNIYPCTKPQEKKQEGLTYDQIMQEVGIYKGLRALSDWRVVVFGNYGQKQSFYINDERMQIQVCDGVKTATFVKTNEKLCMEIV